MILADKICTLRKKNGWSQEELAERMNVSRQAVSKWESAQSIPDLEKILQLSELFGVSTDYLLKDEMGEEERVEPKPDEGTAAPTRWVSLEEANEFLALRRVCAGRIALATLLCILSPVCLILLGTLAPMAGLSEGLAGAIGLIVLLGMVAIAVVTFVLCGLRSEPYEFLENEPFETAYGVAGMVRERKDAFRESYIRANLLGVLLCVLSPMPLLAAAFSENEPLQVGMLCVLLLLVSLGVYAFIWAGVQQSALQKLLQEGDYAKRPRGEEQRVKEVVESVYWMVVLAAYLTWSFLSHDWHITWVVWPVAGALNGLVELLCSRPWKKKD